jgi:hypothetical protein
MISKSLFQKTHSGGAARQETAGLLPVGQGFD